MKRGSLRRPSAPLPQSCHVCVRPPVQYQSVDIVLPDVAKKTGMRSEDLPMPESFNTASLRLTQSRYCFSPVLGSRNNVPFLLIFVKLNIWLMELAIPSKDPWPMRCPPSQLSSTNRMMGVWSATVCSTKFCFAQVELTSTGGLRPY